MGFNSAFKVLIAVYMEFVFLLSGDARHVVSYRSDSLGMSPYLFQTDSTWNLNKSKIL